VVSDLFSIMDPDDLTGLSKHWMTSTSHGSAKIEPISWCETSLDLNGFWALEGLIDILAFLVEKSQQIR